MTFRKVVALGGALTATSLAASQLSDQYSKELLRRLCSRANLEFSCDSASGKLFWNREITLTNVSLRRADASFSLEAGSFKARTSIWGLIFGVNRFFKAIDASDVKVRCSSVSSRQALNAQRFLTRLQLQLKDVGMCLGAEDSDSQVHVELESFASGRYGVTLKRLLTHANLEAKLDGHRISFESFDQRTNTPKPQFLNLKRMSELSEVTKYVILHELNDGILPRERHIQGRIEARTIENLAKFFDVPVAIPQRKPSSVKKKVVKKIVKRRVAGSDGPEEVVSITEVIDHVPAESGSAPGSSNEVSKSSISSPSKPPSMTGHVWFSSRYFKGKPFDFSAQVHWHNFSIHRFLAPDNADEADKLLIFLKQLVDSRPEWDFCVHVRRTRQYVVEADRPKELQAIAKIVEAIFNSE